MLCMMSLCKALLCLNAWVLQCDGFDMEVRASELRILHFDMLPARLSCAMQSYANVNARVFQLTSSLPPMQYVQVVVRATLIFHHALLRVCNSSAMQPSCHCFLLADSMTPCESLLSRLTSATAPVDAFVFCRAMAWAQIRCCLRHRL